MWRDYVQGDRNGGVKVSDLAGLQKEGALGEVALIQVERRQQAEACTNSAEI